MNSALRQTSTDVTLPFSNSGFKEEGRLNYNKQTTTSITPTKQTQADTRQ